MQTTADSKPISEVVAGIVTFNPDISRLQENLQAIGTQISRIYIFDNCSDNLDEIQDYAAHTNYDIEITRSQTNWGMAHALNQLACKAIAAGASHILFLDQDSIAADDLVRTEYALTRSDVGLVCPMVIDRNIGEASNAPSSGAEEVSRAITSGSLVNLEIFQEAGGYEEELFVDWVDYEYCIRLQYLGYRMVKTNETSILHEIGHREPSLLLPTINAEGKLTFRTLYRYNHPLSRVYDQGRSLGIVIRKYAGTPIPASVKKSARYIFKRLVVLERNRLSVASAFIRGYRAGLHNRPSSLR